MDRLRMMGVDADKVAPRLYVGSYNPNDALLRSVGFDRVIRVAFELEKCDFPMDDRPLDAQQLAIANRAAQEVMRELAAGKRVLVTCQMGANRSALVAGIAMIKHYCVPAGRAVATIRAYRRPPPGIPKALFNASFLDALLKMTPCVC